MLPLPHISSSNSVSLLVLVLAVFVVGAIVLAMFEPLADVALYPAEVVVALRLHGHPSTCNRLR